MISIDGFDDAIIGTGMRSTSREVLVYDADKCEEILVAAGYGVNCLPFFLENIDVDSLGERAPIFIYLDSNDKRKDAEETGRPFLKIVH